MKTGLRLLSIFILVILFSCNRYRLLEQKKDGQGRIIYKKYRTLISWPGGNGGIRSTITQEYDSLGNVIKEYGYDNPVFYHRQYLQETTYKNKKVYCTNQYIWWDKVDSTGFYHDYKKKLYKEWINVDSLTYIQIYRVNRNDTSRFMASYRKTIEGGVDNIYKITEHDINLSWDSLLFDEDRKLILDKLNIEMK